MEMELKGQPSKMGKLFPYAASMQGAMAAFITFLGRFGDQSGLGHVFALRSKQSAFPPRQVYSVTRWD
jgi:hypothetical protein